MSDRFNPFDYGFSWTDDNWYDWDSKAAHKAARKARDATAATARKNGCSVRRWSTPNQLMKRGGINSGHPEISQVVTVYGMTTNERAGR